MELQDQNKKGDKDLFEELCSAIGRESVFDNIEERERYSFNGVNGESIPDVVITPHSTEQVSKILSIVNRHNIPIRTRGAGAILSGGALPIESYIVLDLKNMNRIVELNARDLTVTVEPGVGIKNMQEEVAKSRLFYTSEPGNVDSTTIGGIVAKCTGGMTGLKYGVTRDYVLALEIVLPDGSVINAGRKTLKSVAGYDLARFFVGSEETLGVLTKITLKLLPMPEKACTIVTLFKDIDSALKTTDSILVHDHLSLRSLEFVDKTCIDAVSDFSEMEIPAEAEALLVIDVDGNEKNVAKDISRIDTLCKENGALKTSIAHTDEDRNILLDIGKLISPSLSKITSMRLNEELSVPRSKVGGVLKNVYELSKAYSLQVAVFGQIGEGHINLNVICNNGETVEVSARNLLSQILKDVVSIGGTAKTVLQPHEVEMMKGLKKMFDPKGIMNPGRLFGNSSAHRKDAKNTKEI